MKRLMLTLAVLAMACTTTAEGSDDAAERAASSPETTQQAREASSPPAPSGLDGGRLKVIITGRSAAESARSDDSQLALLEQRTASFTEQTGIPVEYFVAPDPRELLTRDCASDCSLDVVLLDMHDVALFGANGWAASLDPWATADDSWDLDDMMPTVRAAMSEGAALYGAPLTATSSFLMYRRDLLREAGIDLPETPTWQQVAEAARALDSADNGAAGICLQGAPSWDGSGAVFTSILNTFGAMYWTAGPEGTIGVSQVDQPEFREAVDFYVGLLLDAGPDDPASLGFDECLDLYRGGDVAMWFDSTSAGPLLESDESPVRGRNGYAQAPVELTDSASWIDGRGFVILLAQAATPELSWQYIRWATGTADDAFAADPDARDGVGVAWQSILDDSLLSDSPNPFIEASIDAAMTAPFEDPGTTPRPGLGGVQTVGVPEFQSVAARCMEQLALTLEGERSVDQAISTCHEIAGDVT